MIQFQRYWNCNMAPGVNIFSRQKPNVGKFAKIWYFVLFLKRNVWRTNNVETRDVYCFLLSKQQHWTYLSKCHKYYFSKVFMPITQEISNISQYDSEFLINFSTYILQVQRYGGLNEALFSDCWILPIFSAWKPNVGHFVHSWYLV